MQVLRLTIIILFFAFTTYSQANKQFVMHVDVSGKDKDTVNKVESYITRELRSLGDVGLVNKNEGWYELEILVLKEKGGFTIAFAITTLCKPEREVSDGKGSVLYETPRVYGFDNLLLFTGSDLRRLCEDFVTELDNLHLKPIRESFTKKPK